MTEEEKALNVIKEEVTKLVDGKLTKSTEGLADKESVTKVSDSVENLTTKFEEFVLAEKAKGEKPMTMDCALSKFIIDNSEKIENIRKSGHGTIELEVTKAVGDMLTTSASNPNGIPAIQGVQIAPPSNVNLRGSVVEPLVTNISTDQSSFAYTDTLPKDGDYAFLAEQEIKPQLDFKIETRYASPVKAAAWTKLTEEAAKDIPQMQSIATDLLRRKHDLKKQSGILFGDGIAPNPTGATVYGRVFSAGALALKVIKPNFMDVVNACVTDIYTTHNYVDEVNYMANIVMINPNDFYIELVSAKDERGLPLYPMAGLFNKVVIGGITIIPFEDIPAGKIFVADLSKYNITNYVGYTVRIGWVNDDFIKNQFVILGESRFHAFVRELDKQAFIYDDFATVKTAITKP